MSKHFKHGLVVGKFLPVHKGHQFLIDTAIAQAKTLTIVVFSDPTEPIPGAVRVAWLQTLYPKVTIAHYDKPLPRDVSGTGHWDIWLDALKSVCAQTDFNAVFSSEPYGEQLAAEFSAEHILVDQPRTNFPVSGSEILQNPVKYKNFLPKPVLQYLSSK